MNGSPALVEADSNEPVQTAFKELTNGKLNITTEEAVTKK